MPNCNIEYSQALAQQVSPKLMCEFAYKGAKNSGHFDPSGIKVRALGYEDTFLGCEQNHFLHVAIHILSGRTAQQKKDISDAIKSKLEELPITDTFITIEVVDIDKPSYNFIER